MMIPALPDDPEDNEHENQNDESDDDWNWCIAKENCAGRIFKTTLYSVIRYMIMDKTDLSKTDLSKICDLNKTSYGYFLEL